MFSFLLDLLERQSRKPSKKGTELADQVQVRAEAIDPDALSGAASRRPYGEKRVREAGERHLALIEEVLGWHQLRSSWPFVNIAKSSNIQV